MTLAAGTGYKVGSPSSATMTVRDDDPTVVSLARVGSGAVAEGDKVELNVTLGRALVAGETIDVPLAIGGTNVTTADWSLAKKSGATNTGVTLRDTGTTTPKVRFSGASAQKATLELTPTADGTTESDETFEIALGADSAFDAAALGTNVGGGADPHGTSKSFSVTVNDRPVVTVTPDAATITEGSRASFSVTTTPVPSADLDVNITRTQSGDFFDPTDLGQAKKTITSALGSASFGPRSNDDSVDEPDGSLTVTVDSGTGYAVGSPSSATVTVRDNDPTIVSLARVGSGAVSEGDTVELNVTLGRALVAGETIDVPLAIGGTNVTTGDWSLAKKSSATNTGVTLRDTGTPTPKVRFSGASAQTATLELMATADGTAESAETFSIALGTDSVFDTSSLGTNVGGGADPHGTSKSFSVTVNNHSGPVVTVTEGLAVTEGDWVLFTLAATPVPSANLVVDTTVAQSGDFFSTGLGSQRLTIVSGFGTGKRDYYPTSDDDAVDEPDGSITLTINNGTGYAVGSPSSATIAVRDNDPTVVSLARVGSGAVTEGDKVELNVTLGRALVAGETIDVPLAIGGTNVTTGDWSLAKKSGATNTGVTLRDTGTTTPKVRFSGAGAQSTTLELMATADGATESAETFSIALGADSAFDASSLGTNVGGGADPHGTSKSFSVSVSDYSGPVATITRDSATVTEGQGARAFFTARTTPAADGILTLRATVTQSGDFIRSSDLGDTGLFYFGHQGYGQIAPYTVNDAVDEPDGSVTVTLAGGTGYAVGSPSSATTTVRDDDPTIVSLVLTRHVREVSEGATVGFIVTLGRALVAGETIDVPLAIGGTGVTTGDWSLAKRSGATNTGVTLRDTGTTTPKVRFEGASAQEATLELTATADGATESAETFSIALGTDSAFDASSLGTNVGGGADPHGTSKSFSVTVSDYSGPVVTIRRDLTTITEGSRASFSVTTTPVPSADLDVNITRTQSGDFFDPTDLGQAKKTITSALGSASFGPRSVNDSVDEPDGSLTVTVDSGTGYVVGSPSSATITVRDDDPTVVSLARTSANIMVNEGGTVGFRVTLARALVAGETIDVPLAIGGTNVTTGDWSLAKQSGQTNTGVTLLDAGTSTPKVRFEGAGAQTATLELTATADRATESTETFSIALGADSAFDAAALGTNVGGGADPHGTDRSFDVTVHDVAPPPAVTVAGGAAVTEGAWVVFTLTATPAPSANLPVNVTWAQSGDFFRPRDLDPSKGAVPSGSSTQHLNSRSQNDSVDEPDGSLTVTVTGGTGYVVGNPSSATVTVRDDDPTIVRLTGVDGTTVSEGATVELNVTLARALVAGETIDVPLAIGGTNVTTGDWSLAKKSGATNTGVTLRHTATSTPKVRFEGAGAQTATLELTATADATAESADETFTIALGTDGAFDAAALGTNVGGGADPDGTDNRLEVTVTDKTTVSFSQANYPVQEGKSVRVELKLSGARTSALTIRVSATALTATGNGVDYSGQTFLATIAAGRTTGAFDIRTTADNLIEGADGETFRVHIDDSGFPADLTKGTPDSALVTIVDGPRLSFTRPQTTTVFEGGRPLEFTLNAGAPYFDGSHGFAHVRYSGRASRYSDYRIEYRYEGLGWVKASSLIAVRAQRAVARIRITARDDGRTEPNESATLTLIALPQAYRDRDQPYYTVGAPRTVTFTVADREAVEPRVESIAHHAPATSTAVSPASLTWRVTFDKEVHDVDASDFTLTGTSATLAVARVAGTHAFDVTASGGNLGSITGGQVVLGLAPDNDITDGSGNAFTRWNEFTSTYWVHDGTTPPPLPVVTVVPSNSVIAEGGRAHFTASPNAALSTDLNLNVTVTQSGDFFQSGHLGKRSLSYSRIHGNWQYGPPSQKDSVDEPDGSLTLTIDSGDGYTVGSPPSAAITIRDDDPTVVSLARTGTGAVTEGGTVELNVTLARALVAGETIDAPLAIGGTNVTTGDWSLGKKSDATNTGVTLLDAGTTTPKVRFEGAGAQTATLELAATADGTAESSETFTIALGSDSAFDDTALGTNVGGGADPHGTDHTFDVTVNDGAGPPPSTPAVEFASATSSAAEDAGTHNVTLDLAPAAPSGGLDIAYTVTGTATAGSGNDFTIQGSGTLSVAAGATTATIPIAINDDSADDDAETVVLTLTDGTDYTLGATAVHTLTIADNDAPVTPAACVSAALLSDVQGYASETQHGSDHVERWRRVLAAFGESNSYASNPMTASEAQTYADRWTRGRWVPVVTALECLENTTPPTVPQITVQGGSAVTEGGNAVFTVSASSSPAASLTVTLTVADDASSDFLNASDQGEKTVTIASGQTSATLTVPTQDDSTDEANGSVTATVSDGTGYTVGSPSTATVAVRDNDPTPQGTPVVRIAAGAGVTEGAGAEFTLTASPTPAASITVDVAVTQSGDFATSGQTGTRTVTIGTGGTATLTVATDDDGTDETNGAITATVQTGTGYTVHGTQNAATVAVADNDVPVVRVTGGTGVTEGTSASFTVTASPTPATDITVNVAITQSGDFATSGQTGTRTVTIGTGGTGTVNVTTVNDTADEPNGRITATVQAGSGYTVATAPNNAARIAVADDDATPGVPTISIADATFSENERLGWFTVRLSKATDQDVRFAYATRDSTPVSATANNDYRAVPRAWKLGGRVRAGETLTEIRIQIRNDNHDENPETFEVEIFDAFIWRSGKVPVTIADGVAVGTITNDDPMPAAWLARFGRTVAEAALDGVADRIAAPRASGVEGTLAGQALTFGNAARGGDEAVLDGVAHRMAGSHHPGVERALVGEAPTFGADAGGDEEAALERSRQAWLGDAGAPPGTGAFGDDDATLETLSLSEALLGSSFTATSAPDASGGSLALWGRAAHSTFDGREGTFSLDGETTTAMLGADYARGDWLFGMALTQSEGEGAYRDTDIAPRPESQDCPDVAEHVCAGAVREGDGDVEASLTAAVPYAALEASQRLKLWGALGVGEGEVTLKPEMGGALSSDITWTMAAAGARSELFGPRGEDGGLSVALVSDGLWARTSSQMTSELSRSDSDVTRLRLGLEGRWAHTLEGGGHVTPKLEAGVRHDGGDAETGFGVELGGGLAWSHPGAGLDLDIEGRTLIAHDSDDLKDRGFAATLGFDPAPASERGPSFSLGQSFGGQAQGGIDALFTPDPLDKRGGTTSEQRWTAEAAWGFAAFGGRFTASPHAGVGLTQGARDYTLGYRVVPARDVPALHVSFGVAARRSEGEDDRADHAVSVEFGARW